MIVGSWRSVTAWWNSTGNLQAASAKGRFLGNGEAPRLQCKAANSIVWGETIQPSWIPPRLAITVTPPEDWGLLP